MNNDPCPPVPDGWEQPPPALLAQAKDLALEALYSDRRKPVQRRLARYYDPEGNYAGASFAELRPIVPWDFTATDLLAITLLSVKIGPRATRRVLQNGPTRRTLVRKLAAIPEAELADAGSQELGAMAGLYEEVKQALSADDVRNPNAWVTASKLCARKRPNLFPVRDSKVCAYLKLASFGNYQLDWQVFRFLIRDEDIITAIGAAVEVTEATAAGRPLAMDHSHLLLLDAAIWTYAVSQS